MDLKPHGYRVGAHDAWFEDAAVPLPRNGVDDDNTTPFVATARRVIEPWLSAVFQSEHLNLLVGSGLTISIAHLAGAKATTMTKVALGSPYDAQIDAHAKASAERMGRGEPNIEDQFRSALALLEGLQILGQPFESERKKLEEALNQQLRNFLGSILETERGIATASHWIRAVSHLQSFLMSFASRAASRERLHIFTTNYDRLIEYGCDLAGLRVIDRFVGSLNPVFRSSRAEIDVHYNPPGIRGEPRYLEGVVRLTKLHGSVDWHYDGRRRSIVRKGLPFGAPVDHSDIPKSCTEALMIYPNASKDVETTAYPYSDLFRDFASSLCRPHSAVITYGYGFGDDHVNRVLEDMLTIPSTHAVIITYAPDNRLLAFLERVGRPAQISLLVGSHFADMERLVAYYLPKPAVDYITTRMAELVKRRGEVTHESHVSAPEGALPAGGQAAESDIPF